jgi:hypothetical protein
MANLGGDKTKRVNAQSMEIFIGSLSNEWLYMQDARLNLSHTETLEPTTGGNSVPYSGVPKNSLSGTILFTTDAWGAAIAGWSALYPTSPTNNEYPIFTLIIRLTDSVGGTTTYTFTTGAKLQSIETSRGEEGAVKVNVNFTMWVNPTIS